MKDRHHRESTLLKMDDKASKFHLKCLWFNNQAYQYSAKVKKKILLKTILAIFETWLLKYRDWVKSRTTADMLSKVDLGFGYLWYVF